MIKPGMPLGGRRPAFGFPRIEAQMVMITSGGQKGGLIPEFLLQFEPQYTGIKSDGAIQISDFQVNMANLGLRMNGLCHGMVPFSIVQDELNHTLPALNSRFSSDLCA